MSGSGKSGIDICEDIDFGNTVGYGSLEVIIRKARTAVEHQRRADDAGDFFQTVEVKSGFLFISTVAYSRAC